jgi:hypothetical protein
MTIRRMKTYTGGQGYVYQYYFVGKRVARGEAEVNEYIFDVTSDRKTMFSVSIFLPDEAVRGWAAVHGRSLTDAEQYAAIKMRLFQAFDTVENLMADGRTARIEEGELEPLLSTLGVQ